MSEERLQFKTELKQLLDIITHSLYSNKEVFLRELISNACDAIDKIRFNALANADLLEGDSGWKIKLIPDEQAGTLTVSDNGIGMSRETIVEDLGTIARSGTQEFLTSLAQSEAKDRPDLIGQFGVGFYASFMVADKVTVISRPAGADRQGAKWISDGKGEFTVETVDKPTRGTDVILHLRDEDKDFLQPWRLRQIVTKFSDFVEHPVVMDVEKEVEDDQGNKAKQLVEEQLNTLKAIWLRPKSEITDEEYQEFYKHIARDTTEPAATIHYIAEGANEFRALLFIPKHKPFDLMWGEPKSRLHLYIRRVFITDQCETLLPSYLRFVRGVVDSSDLPLNVSREMLQQNPLLTRINKNIVKKVLDRLDEMKRDDYEAYVSLYRELGTILKEGVSQDFTNRDRVAGLLLFESAKTDADAYTTLDAYVDAMPPDQEAIYYLTGEERSLLDQSPVLEAFKVRGQDVLFMTDPFDEFMLASLPEYKGKPLKAADKGELPQRDEDEAKQAESQEKFSDLLSSLKAVLPEVKDVRLSNRLKDSAACLVADETGMGAHMERIMERIGRGDSVVGNQRILELNPDHPAVETLQTIHADQSDDPRIADFARLLYDQAVIAEGSKVKDPAAFARRINDLLIRATPR